MRFQKLKSRQHITATTFRLHTLHNFI